MLRGTNKSSAAYNRAVLDWLRRNAPDHAEELNRRGIARGWWDQINYFRITYKRVEETGRSIANNAIN